VWVENRAPGGCRFVVELPARRQDPAVTRTLALIAAPMTSESLELVDQLEAMDVVARRCETLAELRQLLPVMTPELVFVAAPMLGGDPGLVAELRARGAPLVVGLDDGPDPGGPFDATLAMPILDNELREVLRRVPARAARRGAS
jgi:hypothetical protein